MNEIDLAYSFNVPAIPVTGQPRLVYLLLEVKGTDAPASLPVNLAIVVDVSDSMYIRLVTEEQFRQLAKRGILREVLVDGVPAWQSEGIPEEVLLSFPRKIDRVRDALRAAVEQLRPNDRFSLVVFAGAALTLIPNLPGSEKRSLLGAVDGLDRFRLGDETRIGRGMKQGLEALQQGASPGLAPRMLVLTDGFTLDEQDCRAVAAQAVRYRIPISTMGLGGEFNEELMIPIADQTGGEAYLLEDAEDIPPAFARELRRAQAVQYRNTEMKLRLTPGVEVRAVHRVRPSIASMEAVNEGGSYSFPLGDLLAGEESALLVELIVPPRPPGVYRLAQALLACDHPAGGMAGLKARADIMAEYTGDMARAAQVVPRVMHAVEAVSAYRLHARAQADLAAGDVAGATRRLRAAATRLLEMGEAELAAEMERQAADLEHSGQADPQRTKKLRYETRRLTQKL